MKRRINAMEKGELMNFHLTSTHRRRSGRG
jgi:hypothetical protein